MPLIIGLVLAGIALLGFVNLLITRSVSRKRAFAVFQSLGMTIAQLRQLILLEGVLYALIMAAVLVPVSVGGGSFCHAGGHRPSSPWISVYEFTLLPLWVLLPVILILSVAVPLACLNRVTRGDAPGTAADSRMMSNVKPAFAVSFSGGRCRFICFSRRKTDFRRSRLRFTAGQI